jgi:hypothetical protein
VKSGKEYQTIVKLIQLTATAESEGGRDEAASARELSAATRYLPAGCSSHRSRFGAGREMARAPRCELQLVLISAAERDGALLFKGPRSRDAQGGFEECEISGGGFEISGKPFWADQGAVHAAGGSPPRSKETWLALRRPHFAAESKRVEDLFHHTAPRRNSNYQASARKLFVTEKTPGTAFARIPANVLSISLATTPSSVK